MKSDLFPAFKEWEVIVAALGSGAQTLILRKGGIVEDEGGFRPKAGRFWLFPTTFHGQRTRLKPAAFARAPMPAVALHGDITLRYAAETVCSSFLTDWSVVVRLDPYHLWTEATIRERYDRARPPGVHAMIVRVHRLRTPLAFPRTAAMRGCRSWIELPYDPADLPSEPVLTEAAFAARREEFRAIW
ncbi:MAG TPA: DUF1802 family protein [Opitutaceae bacterium]|nr:DUF1802 family protein [Opitutaceae bacterium]